MVLKITRKPSDMEMGGGGNWSNLIAPNEITLRCRCCLSDFHVLLFVYTLAEHEAFITYDWGHQKYYILDWPCPRKVTCTKPAYLQINGSETIDTQMIQLPFEVTNEAVSAIFRTYIVIKWTVSDYNVVYHRTSVLHFIKKIYSQLPLGPTMST